MWADMHCIALVGTDVVAGIGGKHTLRHIKWLVITQHGA